MQAYKRALALLLLVVAVTVGVASSVKQGAQTKNDSPPGPRKWEDIQRVGAANYADPGPADPGERAKRRARGAGYNNRPGPLREPSQDVEALGVNDSWLQGMEALPVAKSDAVVVGEVLQAQSHLSPDKTGVYTEYDIRVGEVLKQSLAAPLTAGGSVSAKRDGGRVRFPSGRVQVYVPHYQGVLRAGGQYVLFLKDDGKERGLYILTGYELSGDRVNPLDGVNLNPGATELPQFARYKAAERASFMSELTALVARPSGGTSR